MKKRITALLLVMTLVFGIAGCGGNETAKDELTSDGKLKLSVFMWDLDTLGSGNDPIYDKLSEKFKVEFEPVTATYAQWREKLNLLFASGDIPDFFICAGTEDVQYKKWIKEGFLLPISDFVTEDKYPNLYKTINMYNDILPVTEGKHYGLPIQNGEANENGVINKHSFWIRKDWVENLGLKLPTTTDELYEVAKAFTENDPDGDGKKDTYGLTSGGVWWMYPMINSFNTSYYNFYKDDSGKLMPEATTDNMKTAIEYLHKMYKEGILDPDFVVNTQEQVYEKFITHKVGIFPDGMGAVYNQIFDKFESAYPGTNAKDYFTHLEILEGPYGTRRIDGNLAFFCMACIRGDVSETKRDTILNILEYMLTEEGCELFEHGVEGVHFTKENEKYVSIIPKGADGKEQTLAKVSPAAQLGNLARWRNYQINDTVKNKEEVEASLVSPRTYATLDPKKYLQLDDTKMPQQDIKTLGDMTLQAVASMVMSKNDDISAEFDAFKKQWMDTKGTTFIEEVNRVADSLK